MIAQRHDSVIARGAKRAVAIQLDCFGVLGTPRNDMTGVKQSSGFALLITIVLLALLVLTVFCLSALTRVGTGISASGTYQVQARQHALLALSQAMDNLQRYASEDDVLTGMAGLTGISEGAGEAGRHWCGVWDRNGQFVRWLASGESGPVVPALTGTDALELVGSGSLGADGADREHVRVLPVQVIVTTRDRTAVRLGGYAWWVGDEGVKLSLVLPNEKHGIDELVTLPPDAPLLANVLSYEQASWIPTTVSQAVLAGQLRTNFHVLGRTHLGLVGATLVSGRLNINSSSARYWRGVAATYNRLKPPSGPSITPAAFGTWMRDHVTLADPGAGKAAGQPYLSVDLFLGSTALAGALGADSDALLAFAGAMRSWLTVRSDTFRVRAYGESANPSDGAKVESVAWCEAIVQRIKDDPGVTRGRYIVTFFRWLGPDDL